MKIIFLSDDFPPQSFGGAGISSYELAAGMKKAGHQVYVITTCRKAEEAGESDYFGLGVFRIASDYPGRWRWYAGLNNPPAVRQVGELLKKIKPDIVHVNNVHFYLSYRSIKTARQYARAVVFTARDVMPFNFAKLRTKRYLENFDCRTNWLDHLKQAKKRWNPLRNFFIRKYFKRADKLFAVSLALKKALEQNGIKDVEVMHTGADVSEWQVPSDATAQYRVKYGLENRKVVLFGGRLSEAKGGKQALSAMVEIAKEIPEAVLLVAASIDGHTGEMVAEAARLGIDDRLIFTGWVKREDMKYVYACADVVLVPSICFDSFPRVVLEAMASGKSVVGTCYGGASEIIEDGVTGYIVNPFGIAEISAKILDLLRNPDKMERFGKAGRERVEADFNLNGKIDEYLSRYWKSLQERQNQKYAA